MPEPTPRTVTGVAPGRVNLIGEHVDYNGGRCLPFALRQTTCARVARRDDGRLVVASGEDRWEGRATDLEEDLDGAPGWVRYVAGVLLALEVSDGLEVVISSDVPIGAGLSSSAALECSVAVAVDALLGLGRTSDELERASVRAESETVGAPTGGLDQAISVHGEEAHALLLDFGTGRREQVRFDPAAHGLGVLVIDTRVSHELTDGGYGQRRDEAWEAARLLGVPTLAEATQGMVYREGLPETLARRAWHVVSEVQRVDAFVDALRADDWAALGPLLDASHTSLRDGYEVSCEELDVAVETAREAGALGARMTGGGFGGSAIALVPLERLGAVRTAVTHAFVARGWASPDFIEADPGPGARVG
ncbi:galactokinase [Nocardioides scoriae]|uniref:Galactokinase n=1 Tax=Nocardioides scoriae TaxID=642780 RepID=A0A1H1NEC4_9ACTN|nr:galactokinase [Nocardioides scoriae]SDR97341.1 galactokinase [Nocardioides scoriae]